MTTMTQKRASADLELEGDWVRHTTPEGEVFRMPLDEFLALAQEQLLETRSGLLPPEVRAVISRGRHTIWVGEYPPMPRTVRWIAADSPSAYGDGTTYTTRTIAWPYLIILGVFE